MIYGTAWKEGATAKCVREAVAASFRGIDTANQKKHYREDYVGEALLKVRGMGIGRDELFLQSKYTYPEGQDHRMPYDPKTDFATQVRSSFASSLKNLHTDYLDSFLLHGPRLSSGMTDADWEVWGAMEALHKEGSARVIGISNTSIHHLSALCERASVKPKIVQNRCYADRGWDKSVRDYCLKNGIVYEGFSLLTANLHVVNDPQVASIARRWDATPQQVIYRFAEKIGILPLTGTTDAKHMKQDLDLARFDLSADDVHTINAIPHRLRTQEKMS
jgi:diketogulonate reductase-like aldo/keto reductase